MYPSEYRPQYYIRPGFTAQQGPVVDAHHSLGDTDMHYLALASDYDGTLAKAGGEAQPACAKPDPFRADRSRRG